MNEATYFQQQYMDGEAPKFKIGDRVRIRRDAQVKRSTYWQEAYTVLRDSQAEGTISFFERWRTAEPTIHVHFNGEAFSFVAEELELAPAELSENPPEAAEQPHGAICELCGQDMLAVDDCNANRQIDYADGTRLRPIPYGSEYRGGILLPDRCHDCNVTVGSFHHSGCDVEECPRCHRQLISCDCNLSDKSLAEAHAVSTQVEQDAKLRQDKAIAAALAENAEPAAHPMAWLANQLLDLHVAEERRHEIALQIIEKYQAHISKVDGVVHRICSILDIRTHIDAETPFDTAELLGTEILPAIREIGAERDSLLARVKTLEDVVRPFARAALDKDVKAATSDRNLYVFHNHPRLIYVNEVTAEFFNTNHLDAALEAMPDVRGANADSEQT